MASPSDPGIALDQNLGIAVSCLEIEPHTVLLRVPSEELLHAALDGSTVADHWQFDLALQLARTKPDQCSHATGLLGISQETVLCELLQYEPLAAAMAQLHQKSVAPWLQAHSSVPNLLPALHQVRRTALQLSTEQWVLAPLGGACVVGAVMPVAAGSGLEYTLDAATGDLVFNAGSAGFGPSQVIGRSYGQMDNEKLYSRFGVAALHNPYEKYDVPQLSKVLSMLEQPQGMIPPPNGDNHDMGTFIRDATKHGPTWPHIPGPNACEIGTLVIARRHVLDSTAAVQAPGSLRQPLEYELELQAWQLLVRIAEWMLASLPTTAAEDRAELDTLATPHSAKQTLATYPIVDHDAIRFRLDKKQVLLEVIGKLNHCISASMSSGVLTVLPLPEGVPQELQDITPEFQREWGRMPAVVRQLLATGLDPSTVPPCRLLRALQLPHGAYTSSKDGFFSESVVASRKGLLHPSLCLRARQAVDNDSRAVPDSVDGAPDHQLNLTLDSFKALVGHESVRRIWQYIGEVATGHVELPAGERQLAADALAEEHLEIFVRRYASNTRPWIPFHLDKAKWTLNLALGADADFEGGKLLAGFGGKLQYLSREEGEATVHPSTLLHAVTRMVGGVRYSLIIFFGKALQS